MKSASGALVSFLRTASSMILVDLYKITLTNGTTIYWTSAGSTVVSGSGTYTVGPVIERGKVKTTVGLEVAELSVTLKGPAVQAGGLGIVQAAVNGLFDGARLELRRLVMATWGDASLGDYIVFSGRISSVNPTSTEVRLSVKSDMELLNVQMPRNLCQPGCCRTLFDSGCRVSRAAFTKRGTASGGTTTEINTNLTDPAGWFDLGVITFTSGPNSGVSRTVKSYGASGTVSITLPLPNAPSGQFTIVPGCDKTMGTCKSKFNNIAAFRGYPFVPKPETAR